MQQFKKTLESQIAKSIADQTEKALAVQSDFEWFSTLLECFYDLSPRKPHESNGIHHAKPTGFK